MNDQFAKSGQPDMDFLASEYQRSVSMTGRERIEQSDQVRLAVWDGQHQDGRKHDRESERVFPFDGASDTRIRLADDLVNDFVDVLSAAFANAQVDTQGYEARDAEVAGAASKALEWARNGGIPGLEDEVEYSAQWGGAYGWTVLQTVWQRRLARRYQDIDLETLSGLVEQLPEEDPLRNLPAFIIDPSLDQPSSDMLREAFPLFVRLYSQAIEDDEIPEMSVKRARRIVRELRDQGSSSIPIPYVASNHPQITALKPYEDVWFPPETVDLQRARAIFRVDWMNEFELRARETSEGWSPAWVTAAIATAGKVSSGLFQGQNEELLHRFTGEPRDNPKRDLVEVVWGYTRAVDEDGVECVHYTVFSPHIEAKVAEYAITGPLDYPHGFYPFSVYRRERPQRKITASRGIPEIVMTWQNEVKVQRDSLTDRTSLSISPPLKVPVRNMGRTYRLGPMQQVAVTRSDEIEWMEPPPGNPREALSLIEAVFGDAHGYFGRVTPTGDPVRSQIKNQSATNRFLRAWLEAFCQALSLMQHFLSDAEWEEITGAPAPDRNFETISRKANWRLHYDIRNANTDFMVSKLEAFAKSVIPLDAAGVIDRAKFAQVAAAWIDPSVARMVVTDQTTASQALFTKVQQDFALMALGNRVPMVESDPTAESQLQYAQQIVQDNPKYQQLLQADPSFQKLVESGTRTVNSLPSRNRTRSSAA
jgi:hypothetical protein